MKKKGYPTPNKMQTFMKRILIILGVVAALTYSGFELSKFVAGPELNVSSPSPAEEFHKPLFSVEGTARNISRIQLNDRKIFIDQNSAFSEQLIAHPGYNIITVEAWDKFGRHIQKTVEVVRKE